jgi:DNA anti-recombination protein RmuC
VAVELLGAAERMAGEIERMRAALDVSGAQANLAERVLDVERVLEDVGCDCACDHASVEEHEPECRPCVACRVAHALWP